MYEVYRVRKQFGWRGWTFAPNKGKGCGCDCLVPKAQGKDGMGKQLDDRLGNADCLGRVASTCSCKETICRCSCGIVQGQYAGDVWLVEANHPRKEIMLSQRYATGDASLPSIDDILETQAGQAQIVDWQPREAVAA